MDLLNINNKIPFRINVEQLGNGRIICMISYKGNTNSLWYIKESEDVYIYRNKLIKASLIEVEKIVKENLLNDLK